MYVACSGMGAEENKAEHPSLVHTWKLCRWLLLSLGTQKEIKPLEGIPQSCELREEEITIGLTGL